MVNYIFQDWEANTGNPKGRFVTLAFRLGQLARRAPRFARWLFLPYRALYVIGITWLLGIELPLRLQVGSGLTLLHGQGLVVNPNAVIGRNCHLKQCTTIGNSQRKPNAAPRIGDNVNVGANSVLIGDISIGNNAIIGAGTVVVKDVPENSTVVGNPGRVISKMTQAGVAKALDADPSASAMIQKQY